MISLDGQRRELRFELLLEHMPMRHPIAVRPEPRIVEQLGPFDRRAEAVPQPRIGHGDDDVAVLRAQRFVRRDREVIVADAARIRPGREQHAERQAHHRQHRVEERDVDVLPFPLRSRSRSARRIPCIA